MRGGFQRLSKELDVLATYTEAPSWEALAYGADWVGDGLVAGCSFYDNKLRLFSL
jgi:hypothetical protein